jgi:hypothetical protein
MCLMKTCLHVFDGDPNKCAEKQNAFMEKVLALDPLRGNGMAWCFHPISGSCYIPGEGKQTVTMFTIFNKHDERCRPYGFGWLTEALADEGGGGNGGSGCPGCGGTAPPLKAPCGDTAGGPGIALPGPPPGEAGPMIGSTGIYGSGVAEAFTGNGSFAIPPDEAYRLWNQLKRLLEYVTSYLHGDRNAMTPQCLMTIKDLCCTGFTLNVNGKAVGFCKGGCHCPTQLPGGRKLSKEEKDQLELQMKNCWCGMSDPPTPIDPTSTNIPSEILQDITSDSAYLWCIFSSLLRCRLELLDALWPGGYTPRSGFPVRF